MANIRADFSPLILLSSSSSSSSSVICQTTGPKPLPKRFLHIVRSRASSYNWQYPLLSLRSSSSFLRLLPRLLVTSICPFIFPSITCCRKQFLRKMWPIQLAFRFIISCRILKIVSVSIFLCWVMIGVYVGPVHITKETESEYMKPRILFHFMGIKFLVSYIPTLFPS